MTIKYLDSRRIEGLSTEVDPTITADYTSDFSTRDGFSADYSSYLVVNTTDERIDFSANANSLNGLITKDLGAGFGSTKFLARWHLHVTNANLNTTAGQAVNLRMGLADSTSQTAEVPTNDQIYWQTSAGNSAFYQGLMGADGSTNTNDRANDDPISASSDNTDWYFELKRDGNDFTGQFYSDSTFETTIGSARSLTISNVGSLRYLYFRVFTQTATGTPLFDGYIDNIEIYDGITTTATGYKPSLTPAVSGGWVELGRTTLGSAGDSIDVTSLADKRYYMVLSNNFATGGGIRNQWRFNSDSGSNYASRRSTNGATDTTNTSDTSQQFTNLMSSSANSFGVSHIANYSSEEKLIINQQTQAESTGSGSAPTRSEVVGKWTNTSNAINSIQLYNDSTGDYNTGSEVVVLGWDPSDTHTTNFWEQLADVTLSSAGDTIDSGTFTAKKYLWFQYFNKASGSAGVNIQFNGDTGSNYARREGKNGTADSTVANQTDIEVRALYGNAFGNFFVINNQSNEKLVLGHEVNQNTAGATNIPQRNEIAGKWANTSNQITSIQLINDGGGDFDTGSFIKVWGSD